MNYPSKGVSFEEHLSHPMGGLTEGHPEAMFGSTAQNPLTPESATSEAFHTASLRSGAGADPSTSPSTFQDPSFTPGHESEYPGRFTANIMKTRPVGHGSYDAKRGNSSAQPAGSFDMTQDRNGAHMASTADRDAALKAGVRDVPNVDPQTRFLEKKAGY